MSLSRLPSLLTTTFLALAAWLDRRTGKRLPQLLLGILFARGRRTCTSWFRPVRITDEFRPAYTTIHAVGRHCRGMSGNVLRTVTPLVRSKRLLAGIDDTHTPRYGPMVEGCGIHRNPTPGPAGEERFYGHVFVTLAVLASHPRWNTIALPIQGQLYVRKIDVEKLPTERRWTFRTKLEIAVEQLNWLKTRVADQFEELWAVVDGGYSKKPVIGPAMKDGWVLVGRLRRDAALWSVPGPKKPGQRGPAATYGKERISLAKRAGHNEGWEQVECVQYGQSVTKTIKTFEATWRPAAGAIRVVLVREDQGWVAFFCTKRDATAKEILEAAADRGAIEQTFKDVKEVWGAGQQQVRNVHSNEGCFNLNLWMASLVEAWAWDCPAKQVCDRSGSPWDSEPRRPSHSDKRKALQNEVIEQLIQEALSKRPTKKRMRQLAERIRQLAT